MYHENNLMILLSIYSQLYMLDDYDWIIIVCHFSMNSDNILSGYYLIGWKKPLELLLSLM